MVPGAGGVHDEEHVKRGHLRPGGHFLQRTRPVGNAGGAAKGDEQGFGGGERRTLGGRGSRGRRDPGQTSPAHELEQARAGGENLRALDVCWYWDGAHACCRMLQLRLVKTHRHVLAHTGASNQGRQGPRVQRVALQPQAPQGGALRVARCVESVLTIGGGSGIG